MIDDKSRSVEKQVLLRLYQIEVDEEGFPMIHF